MTQPLSPAPSAPMETAQEVQKEQTQKEKISSFSQKCIKKLGDFFSHYPYIAYPLTTLLVVCIVWKFHSIVNIIAIALSNPFLHEPKERIVSPEAYIIPNARSNPPSNIMMILPLRE